MSVEARDVGSLGVGSSCEPPDRSVGNWKLNLNLNHLYSSPDMFVCLLNFFEASIFRPDCL